MTLLSVLFKDLLARMRTWRMVGVVVLHLGLLSIIAFVVARFLLRQQNFGFSQGPQVGQTLFATLATTELLLIVFITPAVTATVLSSERERRTFELLLLTQLSGPGIVAGKVLGTLCFVLLLIFASLPVFSLVFLFGGVAPGALARVFVLYFASATTLASLGVCVSALARRSQVATAVSYALVLALVFGSVISAVFVAPRQAVVTITGTGQTPQQPTSRLYNALIVTSPLVALASTVAGGTNSGSLVPLVNSNAASRAKGLSMWRLHLGFDVVLSVLLWCLASLVIRPPRWARGRG